MGCGESKIKKIHLSPDRNHGYHASNGANGSSFLNSSDRSVLETTVCNTVSGSSSNGGGSGALSPDNEDEMLPNRLLAAIPVSDLGESLDSR